MTVLNACVSDRDEQRTFFVNDNDGWSSLVEPIGTRGGQFIPQEVRTTPLDELVDEFGMPDFMKIDVEGAEPQLVAALARHGAVPRLLALEIDFYHGDPITELADLGYDRFHLVRQPNLEPDPGSR